MTGWVRSSHCAAGDCIEVKPTRHVTNHVQIRRNRNGLIMGAFIVSRAEWDAFIAGVKAGDFDQLTGDTP